MPDEGLDLVIRKAGHMAVFGILALLIRRALVMATGIPRPGSWAVALATLYAITDELHQGAVSGRHASPVDVGIDAAGAVIAVALIGFYVQRRSPR